MQKKCSNKNNGGVFPSLFFKIFILFFIFIVLFIFIDSQKPPKQQKLVRISVSIIDFYKIHISRPAVENHNIRVCRFNPSCSIYAKKALLKHGFVKGGYYATIRILKCNPFYGKPIMEDPVP